MIHVLWLWTMLVCARRRMATPNQSVLSRQASSHHEQVTVRETYQSAIPSTAVFP